MKFTVRERPNRTQPEWQQLSQNFAVQKNISIRSGMRGHVSHSRRSTTVEGIFTQICEMRLPLSCARCQRRRSIS